MSGSDPRAAGGETGGTIWLTGLPGAGKSTIAQAVADLLSRGGRHAHLLDGDVLRATISADLGFDAASRRIQARRAAQAAVDVAQHGRPAIVALISPFANTRRDARERHERAGLAFVEVHVATPAEVCRARDPKGLWARAARGELSGLTGFDAPYEPPQDPEVRVASGEPVSQAAERIVTAYRQQLRASAGSRARSRPDRRAAV